MARATEEERKKERKIAKENVRAEREQQEELEEI
jgi:hypothetical protein